MRLEQGAINIVTEVQLIGLLVRALHLYGGNNMRKFLEKIEDATGKHVVSISFQKKAIKIEATGRFREDDDKLVVIKIDRSTNPRRFSECTGKPSDVGLSLDDIQELINICFGESSCG